MNFLYKRIQDRLELLQSLGNKRRIISINQKGVYIDKNGKKLLNLSSNDYLALSNEETLYQEFLSELTKENYLLSSSSSRLLTGNHYQYTLLEKRLSSLFNSPSALVFNSGYHMNCGILPAICSGNTLIFSDELIHASIIDGILLSKSKNKAKNIRYRHNDLNHLSELLQEYGTQYEEIIIATESIFSMDGDEVNLRELVRIKKQYPQVLLYVDEAHAIGVRGEKGLGLAEEYDCIGDIDFLVGTFGKALFSYGGYLICKPIIKEYLVNHMRPLIFTTSLPPINVAWTSFILSKLEFLNYKRLELQKVSNFFREELENKGYKNISSSHIIPIILHDNFLTIKKAEKIQENGFYVLPIRPPTVPKNTSRLRFSLHADVKFEDVENIMSFL